jgi:hypothetical protein
VIYIIFSSHFNSDGKVGDQDAGMQGQTVTGWSIFFSTCKLNINTILATTSMQSGFRCKHIF